MTYRIMVKTASGAKDQYQFLTYINENGENEIYESESLVEIDAKIEKMINGNYRKKDLLVVSVVDFNVFADIAENNSSNTSSEETTDNTNNTSSSDSETTDTSDNTDNTSSEGGDTPGDDSTTQENTEEGNIPNENTDSNQEP